MLSLAGIEPGKKLSVHARDNLSTASASRDLRSAVEQGLLEKEGEKALTRYRVTD